MVGHLLNAACSSSRGIPTSSNSNVLWRSNTQVSQLQALHRVGGDSSWGWLFSILLCARLPFGAACFCALLCPLLQPFPLQQLYVAHCHTWDGVMVVLCRTRQACPGGDPDGESPDQGGRSRACRSNGKVVSPFWDYVCFKSELQKTKSVCGYNLAYALLPGQF